MSLKNLKTIKNQNTVSAPPNNLGSTGSGSGTLLDGRHFFVLYGPGSWIHFFLFLLLSWGIWEEKWPKVQYGMISHKQPLETLQLGPSKTLRAPPAPLRSTIIKKNLCILTRFLLAKNECEEISTFFLQLLVWMSQEEPDLYSGRTWPRHAPADP